MFNPLKMKNHLSFLSDQILKTVTDLVGFSCVHSVRSGHMEPSISRSSILGVGIPAGSLGGRGYLGLNGSRRLITRSLIRRRPVRSSHRRDPEKTTTESVNIPWALVKQRNKDRKEEINKWAFRLRVSWLLCCTQIFRIPSHKRWLIYRIGNAMEKANTRAC